MPDLSGLSVFKYLSQTQIENLCSAGEPMTFASDDVIRDPSGEHDWVYVLVKGSARVHLDERELAEIHAPGVVGEIEFLCREFQPVKVVAIEPVDAIAFKFDRLEARLADGDGAAMGFMVNVARVLARRLASMNDRFIELADKIEADDPRTSDLVAFQRQLFRDWDT